VNPESCPSFVTISPGRVVRCTKPAHHGPPDDMHHGLLRVTLPDGQAQAGSLVWSTSPNPWDERNLRRAT
jgi:hypothetical protein